MSRTVAVVVEDFGVVFEYFVFLCLVVEGVHIVVVNVDVVFVVGMVTWREDPGN